MTMEGKPCGNADTITCPAAHPHIIQALTTFGYTTCESIAYYLSYLSFESENLAHVINKYPAPGRPGQGTYSMMMPNNLAEFVKANSDNADVPLPDSLKDIVADIEDPLTDPQFAILNSPDEDPERAVFLDDFREPLLVDELAFMPAAWYYSDETTITACQGALDKMGTEEGLTDVITTCTGIVGDEPVGLRITKAEQFLAVLEGGEVPAPGEGEEEAPVDPPANEEEDASVDPPADDAPVVEDPVEDEEVVEDDASGAPPADDTTTPPVDDSTTPPADDTTPPPSDAAPVPPADDATTTPPSTENCLGINNGGPTCLSDRTKIFLCNFGTFIPADLPAGTRCTCTTGTEDGCPGVIGWA